MLNIGDLATIDHPQAAGKIYRVTNINPTTYQLEPAGGGQGVHASRFRVKPAPQEAKDHDALARQARERDNGNRGASMSTTQKTDGHWPVAEGMSIIRCECGQAPRKPAARQSMAHVWHMGHRRRLKLRPVEYVWPGRMEGLSSGGYMQVRNAEWRNGKWERI